MGSAYRMLEHPADLGLEARGGSLAEVFQQAALGLTSVFVEPEGVEALRTHTLEMSSTDIESLLVKFLSEILFLYDAHRFLTARVEVKNISAERLTAVLHGEEFKEGKHRIRTDVKAITYHQLSVRREEDEWVATVFFDI